MEKGDWRFNIMMCIRMSFREKWTLEQVKEKIDTIIKAHENEWRISQLQRTYPEHEEECLAESSQCFKESRACGDPAEFKAENKT